MSRVLRELHPVGHGAFFTERLQERDRGRQDIIVIYDCGCKSKEETIRLQDEVDHFFNEGETINYLFISHFDSDHVSGLKLLKPYLDDHTSLIMPFSYEYLYLIGDSPILQSMNDTFGFLDRNNINTKKYWVRYTGSIENWDVSEPSFLDIAEMRSSFIESGSVIGCLPDNNCRSRYKWMYVPFNLYNDSEYRRKFEKEVADRFDKSVDEISAIELEEKAIKKLREIYKGIGKHSTDLPNDKTNKSNGSKNINENSLIVLSKAVCHICYQDTWSMNIDFGCYSYDGSCLYTGDCNLGNATAQKTLKSSLRKFTNIPVYMMQLPHHGSRQYYNMDLLKDEELFLHLFVNCGEYDYRQTSFPQLLVDIVRSCVCAAFVTDHVRSNIQQHIYIC